MAFEGRVICPVALMEITLPSRIVRLCDGGFILWGSDKFESVDEHFGAVHSAEAFEEKTGDEAPGGKVTFLPPSATAATLLSNPAFQGARMRFWLGEYDRASGQVVGTPSLTADLAIDTVTLKRSKGMRSVDIEFESAAKLLFLVMRGNALNDRFHQQCYPGELGMSNATGMPRSSAWGADNAG
ncbi:hypothetical protein [Sphingobium sp.]|mgnify:CR=1 FL=1|uniref:hypothetical protein n=1 Tax=Sphingobium sp. TaxID=1912891 RepID=UPI002E2280CF